MKKLLLLFALVLTVCSTAMAEVLNDESAVGTIGTLDGREAMVVDLGGTIGKVAIATRNVGAEKASDKMVSITFGTSFNLGKANDPNENGLTDGWYIPSKAELEALQKNLTPNKGTHCVEWKVTDNATLYLPTWHSSSSTPYYGYYVTSDRVKEDDTWKCWIYFFNFYDSDNTFGGNYFEKDDEQETEGCAIRPFHKLPIPANKIYYTSSDGQIVTPFDQTAFGGANIVSNEYDEGKGKGCIKFDSELTSIGRAFAGCKKLVSIILPDKVTSIGSEAFRNCTSLSSVTLPSELTTIGAQAFENCQSLTSITLPGKLTTMNTGGCHFIYCENLFYAIFQGTTPPAINTEYNPFPGTGSNVGGTVLFVPSGTVTAYETVGFTNVYDINATPTEEFKNKFLGIIVTEMNSLESPESIGSAIDACKNTISNGTDLLTIINAYKNAFMIINLQKAKEAALIKIDKLVEKINSLDFDGKEEYLTLLVACRNNILNASGIDEVEAAMTTVNRFVAKKDLENLILHHYNFSIEQYLARIDEATSEEAINAIVNEAKNDFNKTHKVRIGDDWYVLNETPHWIGGEQYRYTYSLENCPMTFMDAAEYVSRQEFTADEVHYSRDLTPVEGVWQCWCVPFDVTVDNTKFDAAEIEGILVNADGEPIVAFRKLADGATLHANKVYVIRAKAGKGKLELTLTDVHLYKPEPSTLCLQSAHYYFTFFGNYVYGTPGWSTDFPHDALGSFTYYTLNDKGQFSIRAKTDIIKPQRFWVTVNEIAYNGYYPAEQHATAKEFIDIMVLGDEDVTGIQEASPKSSPEGKDLIYNLQGQKVTHIQKGQVYIMGGKKYIAK